MVWIALGDAESGRFAPAGLVPGDGAPEPVDTGPDALMVRGSLLIEVQMPQVQRPRPLVRMSRAGSWPFHLTVLAVPGGGLALALDLGTQMLHHVFEHPREARVDVLRLTYSWDSPRRWGRLALEVPDGGSVTLIPIIAPAPFRVADLRALFEPGPDRFVAPCVTHFALSSAIEPVGPLPSLSPDAPVATPDGYRRLGTLRRGDLVVTPDGRSVPVLNLVSRAVPARGTCAPLCLRAPFFGLAGDVDLGPAQRLVLTGSEVEYMFGHQAVLLPAGHLAATRLSHRPESGDVVRYCNVLLPDHDEIDVAGLAVESLYIGRLRRNRDALAASVLAGFDRQSLPEHRQSVHPVLRAYDARVLIDHRAA